MKLNRKLATFISCLLLLSFIVVQASDRHAKLGERRTVSLPAAMVLDEFAQPVISATISAALRATQSGAVDFCRVIS